MIRGIEHVAIAAKDASALADWYSAVLGFEVVYQSAKAVFVKSPDGSMIEIIHSDGDRGAQTVNTQGIRHIALTVTEFDSVYAQMRSKSVAFDAEPLESKGTKVVFFRDPEGNILHLIQRTNPL